MSFFIFLTKCKNFLKDHKYSPILKVKYCPHSSLKSGDGRVYFLFFPALWYCLGNNGVPDRGQGSKGKLFIGAGNTNIICLLELYGEVLFLLFLFALPEMGWVARFPSTLLLPKEIPIRIALSVFMFLLWVPGKFGLFSAGKLTCTELHMILTIQLFLTELVILKWTLGACMLTQIWLKYALFLTGYMVRFRNN